MILNIKDLENSKNGRMELEINEIIAEFNPESPVCGNLKIAEKGLLIEVKGYVETDIVIECDRCLKEFLHHIEINIDEKFVKGKIIDDNVKEFELKSDNFVEELGSKQEINLTDLIYQNIVLNTPSSKLCDIKCEGVETLKDHLKEKVEDPRMDVFKDLKDKLK